MSLLSLSDYDFLLPPELIAQYPLKQRSSSRLLCLNRGNHNLEHKNFSDLPNLLNPGDLLVLNDTKVLPARFYLKKNSGAKVEVLIERILDASKILVHLKSNHPLKIGTELVLDTENFYFSKINSLILKEILSTCFEVIAREDDLFILEFTNKNVDFMEVLDAIGHMPLPPYITRADEIEDLTRYQTVFAKEKGAVAAPTAGLHFDESLLKEITEKGVETAFLTLHVGAGTFQPVRHENILQHKMHAEHVTVSKDLCEKILETKKRGGRVIAVGTTVVRSLETATLSGEIKPFSGDTDIFIYPGFKFKCVDVLVTNFHLPKSTLLMLVSALSGHDFMMSAYQEAIKQKYRFFSYGDAMVIF